MVVQARAALDPVVPRDLSAHPLGDHVTRPGPLLWDVRAQLPEDAERRRALRARAREVVAEVEAALLDEAALLVEHTALELDAAGPTRRERGPASTDDAPSPSVDDEAVAKARTRVRHRFDVDGGDQRAARVVVLRDRRRGRRGGDPPA